MPEVSRCQPCTPALPQPGSRHGDLQRLNSPAWPADRGASCCTTAVYTFYGCSSWRTASHSCIAEGFAAQGLCCTLPACNSSAHMLLLLVALSATCYCAAPYYHHLAGVAIVRCARSDAVKVGGCSRFNSKDLPACNHQLPGRPKAKAPVPYVVSEGIFKAHTRGTLCVTVVACC